MALMAAVDIGHIVLYSMAVSRCIEQYRNTEGDDQPTRLRKYFLKALAWVCGGNSFGHLSQGRMETVLPDRLIQPGDNFGYLLRDLLSAALDLQVPSRVADGTMFCKLLD